MHMMVMSFQFPPATVPNPGSGVNNVPVSQPIIVSGLIQKTIEIRAIAAELAANQILVQGSITCNSNVQAIGQATGWFNLLTVTQPGIHKIVIPDPVAGSSSEPCLLAVRLMATEAPQQGPTIFPPSLIATFSGLWLGSGEEWLWTARRVPYVG